MRVAVFASGNGSNFEAIATSKYKHLEIAVLICDKPNAYCLERSKILNIPAYTFNYKDYKTKKEYENSILKVLKESQIDIIALAGYMRVIGKTILEAFPNRILNIHPSLLPTYKGLNAIKMAYNQGEKAVGVTIHFVNEDLDGGEIIVQESFEVQNKSFDEVETEIHQFEHKLYPQVLKDLFDQKTKKILIIGNGGREHAIAMKLYKSKQYPRIYAINASPGMSFAHSVDLDQRNIKGLVDFALSEKIDLTIVGPEEPLSMGIVNEFNKHHLPIFGPSKEAAIIESSKKYAKALMEKYLIPTAKYIACSSLEDALNSLSQFTFPVVLKFDGLAAGKGVVIANEFEGANIFLENIFINKQFGTGDVIIEEFLEGPEFSLMAFVNGDKVYPMEIAQDHKRAYDGDKGPNTGGMGAYSPVPLISKSDIDYSINNIMKPVANALVKEGRSFLGVLYGGLMKTKDGIKVIEFNARFGDPETEVVLPRLENDLVDVILAVMNKEDLILEWNQDVALGVVMASMGYPLDYDKGIKLNNIPIEAYHMGTSFSENEIVTNGGRVLMVLGRGKTFKEAQKQAYQNVNAVQGGNLFYRNDIGYQMLDLENKK